MEPYREDKPWIRFNPDAMKQSILETILSIPGARAIKYYHDNPEGSAAEFVDLLAEDIVPEYRNLIKPALRGEDIDWEDAAKEAAIYGIPMPYTRFPKGHPKAGEAIPNNLKEGLGKDGWANVKSNWKNNTRTRKLYVEPPEARRKLGITEGRMSTRARVNATADARNLVDVPAGPYQTTNTGSNLVSQGQQLINTNAIPIGTSKRGKLKGTNAWQGDMYPPGRSLARLDEAGPYVWDAVPDQREYIRKLNDVINENENKWEYLINKTRTKLPEGSSPLARLPSTAIVPKEDIVSIALAQGRPDIAARVMADNESRISSTPGSLNYNPRFSSYKSSQRSSVGILDNAKWKDIGNRQVEKELREQFSQLPEDDLMRYKFADYYGVPDLYNDWIANPEYWKEFRKKTAARRHNREISNTWNDIQYQRDIKR